MADLTPDDNEALLGQIASTLSEIYTPAGVLMFWSAGIKYLDGRRPCDLWAERDSEGLRLLFNRLESIGEGNFA